MKYNKKAKGARHLSTARCIRKGWPPFFDAAYFKTLADSF